MQENQIKVGDLVISEDTLFVQEEEQLPGIVVKVWSEIDTRGEEKWREMEMCTVQHPAIRSVWQTRFLKILVRA